MQVDVFALSNIECSDRECNVIMWKMEDKNLHLYFLEKYQVYLSSVKIRPGSFLHSHSEEFSQLNMFLYGHRFPI